MTRPDGDPDPEDADPGHSGPRDAGPRDAGHGDADERPRPVSCARCGTSAQEPPPTWTCSVENGVRRYFCDACSREHLRSIEGRLDSAWW